MSSGVRVELQYIEAFLGRENVNIQYNFDGQRLVLRVLSTTGGLLIADGSYKKNMESMEKFLNI